jgi:hypothetical protein
MPSTVMNLRFGLNSWAESVKLIVGTGMVVEVVDVEVVVVVKVWTAARIHFLRPATLRHTTMTGFLFTRMDTRVPSVAFGHACPIDTAFADTAGIAVHTRMALRVMKTFFTAFMLLSNN